MTKKYSTVLQVTGLTALLALLLFTQALTANALQLPGVTDATYDIEVRAADDCDDGDDRCDPGTTNISVTKELDKATPAAADTNVCDGVTCPDGSCAATPSECSVSAVNPDYRDTDADGDGYGDAAASANYNNTRSNRSSIANPDVGGDTATGSRGAIREGGQTIDAGTVPDTSRSSLGDDDSDGDGLDDGTQRAQDWNATRSNKPSRAIFSDTDADGRPEVSLRAGGFIKLGGIDGESTAEAADDGEVVCWGQAEGAEGQVYAWGRGLCVALSASEGASDTARTRLAALQIRGANVRSWSNEERAAWREYQESKATTSAEERLADKMITQTQANERIQRIEADENEIAVRYQAKIKLFGLFPIEREIAASTAADGEITIDYPWYRILSQVPEETTIKTLLQELSEERLKREDQTTPLLYQ